MIISGDLVFQPISIVLRQRNILLPIFNRIRSFQFSYRSMFHFLRIAHMGTIFCLDISINPVFCKLIHFFFHKFAFEDSKAYIMLFMGHKVIHCGFFSWYYTKGICYFTAIFLNISRMKKSFSIGSLNQSKTIISLL